MPALRNGGGIFYVCLANQVAYGGGDMLPPPIEAVESLLNHVEGFGYGSGSGNRRRIFVPFVYGSVSKSTFFFKGK